jgi:hypothetical protein
MEDVCSRKIQCTSQEIEQRYIMNLLPSKLKVLLYRKKEEAKGSPNIGRPPSETDV